jgi:3-deoxy-D-manno-octulosonic-acid transferase
MVLYKLFLFLYPKIASILAIFNQKANDWCIGQKQVWNEVQKAKTKIDQPIVWIHAASYGEFEQGLPIIEAIRAKYPSYKIWLTFFSPSGYLHRKNDPSVDVVTYLPLDGPNAAEQFIETIQPSLIVFIKYEFWYYYLKVAKEKSIPTILVAAIFRADQIFFKWYGGFYKKILQLFNYILVQDASSQKLIEGIYPSNQIFVTGDTRFDRVLSTAQNKQGFDWMKNLSNNPTIIAGSTWDSDHSLLSNVLDTVKCNWIIVPHHVDEKAIDAALTIHPKAITLSKWENTIAKEASPQNTPSIIIVDRIGILRNLYQYATISYTGGGFTKDGIHNVLEPAAFGVPVIWGPNDEKYREAIGLRNAGGGKQIQNTNELKDAIETLLSNETLLKEMGSKAAIYVKNNAGATNATLSIIQEKRLLTN